LDQLKQNPDTRHIPVHVVSAEEDRDRSIRMGAFAFTSKHAEQGKLLGAFKRLRAWLARERRCVVIVGDSARQRRSLAAKLRSDTVAVLDTPLARAKSVLGTTAADCIVVALQPDAEIGQFVAWLRRNADTAAMPVIARVAASPPPALADTLDASLVRTISGDGTEALVVDAVAAALHLRVVSRPKLDAAGIGAELAGKTVAIIDDDIRNIFSLTALLEQHGVRVLYAESGPAGLALLAQNPGVDIVLIDIMMPELDGYETIREIRKRQSMRHLPLIAVTAKAMADDRERCLEAGASDYLSKPIETDRLLSVLRVWLTKEMPRVKRG
jgi:CheY-like chemotaxis protein